jgi:succinate dehydrogenase/fumarate reductase flavoprotein subunit
MAEKIVETDVLVVGGGLAGCFAALKAKEKGVDVVLVDKGYVSKSGQSPWAGIGIWFFNPEEGHNLDAWMDAVTAIGEYVNNREWTEIVFKDSIGVYQDLVSWGVKFTRREPSQMRVMRSPHPYYKGGPRVHRGQLRGSGREALQVLRKQAVKRGVKIMDRLMVTDLMKQEGRVVGAIGFHMESPDLYIFNAKATILCTGAGSFKPWGGYPICNLTADGHVMAYRAGAEIAGKEFQDFHPRTAELSVRRRRRGFRGRGRVVNAEGDEIRGNTDWFNLGFDFEAHAGRAPIFRESEDAKVVTLSGECAGMSNHTTDGVWPVNTQCTSCVPGLYAAGDSLGAHVVGATYESGFATMWAMVTGARAGLGAVEYAGEIEKTTVNEEELARLKKITLAPLERKGGFTPRWVTQVLQNLMIPYFISRIKHEKRLKAALTLVEFLRDHLVPKLTAKDPHELRLAHETKNMVLNAEMRLRAALFRTESRGGHYREDYPRRDDPAWLAWVLLKEENGKMTANKKSIPKAWWPDLSKPYEERYFGRFPGE